MLANLFFKVLNKVDNHLKLINIVIPAIVLFSLLIVSLTSNGSGSMAPSTSSNIFTNPTAEAPAADDTVISRDIKDNPAAETPADDEAPATDESDSDEISITASSGSAGDIQAAVDSIYSSGGGIVYIPEGTFNLGGSVTIPGNTKLIGAGTEETVLRTSGTSQVVYVTGDNARLSGFSLISSNYSGGTGIEVGNCIDFRIDHLHIEGYASKAAIYVKGGDDVRGVIDHNYIKNKIVSDLGYGVEVLGGEKWKSDLKLGTQNAVFIEDNTFINCRHAVAANMGGYYVFRHNLIQQNVVGQPVDAHGPAFGSSEGTQAFEIYDNIIEQPQGYNTTAMCIRGGSGVVFGNVTRGYTYGFLFLIEFGQSGYYPLYHQPHDVYIWDNSFDGQYGVGYADVNNTSSYVKQNRDWFAYAQPGYTPYTYPHPLVTGDQ